MNGFLAFLAVSTFGLVGAGITEIRTKTGSINWANTNDDVTIEICDLKKNCCSTNLDNLKRNDFEKGNVDAFDTPAMLGKCSGMEFWGEVTATLTTSKSDGWFVEWAEIELDNNRAYSCMFNVWLDDAKGYQNSMTSTCEEESGLDFILTKTDTRSWADTNDNIRMTICDASGSCCKTGVLDDKSRDDFKRGAVDDFADPSVLGECQKARMKVPLTATLELEKTDGWYVNWAKLALSGGRDLTCFFDTWLDNDSSDKSITNSKNVTCSEDTGLIGLRTKTSFRKWADTNDNIQMTICDNSNSCCMTGILDDDSRDDFKKGAVDDFSDPTVLGECRSADLYGPLTASLALEKNDGWYVDWAQFSLAGGRDYTCFFDTWLDNDSSDKSITNIKNVTCTEDVSVIQINTKTGSRAWADTNDNIRMTICDASGSCCKTDVLDDKARDDFKRGAVDDFMDRQVLGECRTMEMRGPLTATLDLEKTDGWYVKWAKIYLQEGRDFLCNFNTWLDNDSSDKSITNSKNVTCNQV